MVAAATARVEAHAAPGRQRHAGVFQDVISSAAITASNAP